MVDTFTPLGSAAGGSVNLSISLSNVAKLAAHPKFVWVFNANCDGTIIYNDPVYKFLLFFGSGLLLGLSYFSIF
jgi:hypothetical protein